MTRYCRWTPRTFLLVGCATFFAFQSVSSAIEFLHYRVPQPSKSWIQHTAPLHRVFSPDTASPGLYAHFRENLNAAYMTNFRVEQSIGEIGNHFALIPYPVVPLARPPIFHEEQTLTEVEEEALGRKNRPLFTERQGSRQFDSLISLRTHCVTVARELLLLHSQRKMSYWDLLSIIDNHMINESLLWVDSTERADDLVKFFERNIIYAASPYWLKRSNKVLLFPLLSRLDSEFIDEASVSDQHTYNVDIPTAREIPALETSPIENVVQQLLRISRQTRINPWDVK